MERHSFAMEIKKGKKNEYRQILGEIWPDLTAFLDQEKVHNFSIWNCDSLIFGYYETDENNEFSEEKKADYYLLPRSIYEWILIEKTDDLDPVYLRLMVIDTNSDPDKVKPEELLSDQVYLYERKTGKVRIA